MLGGGDASPQRKAAGGGKRRCGNDRVARQLIRAPLSRGRVGSIKRPFADGLYWDKGSRAGGSPATNNWVAGAVGELSRPPGVFRALLAAALWRFVLRAVRGRRSELTSGTAAGTHCGSGSAGLLPR